MRIKYRFVSAVSALMFMVLQMGFTSQAFAQSSTSEHQLPHNVFSLSASASGEAANDLMQATLTVRADGDDAAQLQSQVNASMQWALTRLRPYTLIDVKTQDYQTYPRYDRKRENIIGWSASQSLQLESSDIKSAGEAILKLQERLQVTGIQFMPKPDTRKAVEDQLINTALNAFKHRATLIRDNIGEPSYNLLDINVQTGSQFVQQVQRRGTAALSQYNESEPGLQGGTSQITVQVNGRIQLGLPHD